MTLQDHLRRGLYVLAGRTTAFQAGADPTVVAPTPPPAAPPPSPAPAPAPAPLTLPQEAAPLKASDLRDQLATAAGYAFVFGLGMGALTDERRAAVGLLKTAVVLAIPAVAITVVEVG